MASAQPARGSAGDLASHPALKSSPDSCHTQPALHKRDTADGHLCWHCPGTHGTSLTIPRRTVLPMEPTQQQGTQLPAQAGWCRLPAPPTPCSQDELRLVSSQVPETGSDLTAPSSLQRAVSTGTQGTRSRVWRELWLWQGRAGPPWVERAAGGFQLGAGR